VGALSDENTVVGRACPIMAKQGSFYNHRNDYIPGSGNLLFARGGSRRGCLVPKGVGALAGPVVVTERDRRPPQRDSIRPERTSAA